jgi:tetratricopeptide (TPR) repeat protein
MTRFVLISGSLIVVCLVAVTTSARHSLARDGSSVDLVPLTTIGAATGTPAERRIAAARAAVDLHPKRVSGWNDLAMGLTRRARETANPAFYAEAWTATEHALALAPTDLDARKLQVWILLGQHEFARAVDAAEPINKQMPDDVMVYGLLVDGYIELGRYAEAEKAAQWMLDLRPGNLPGLTRAAHLRELFGDHEGAVELMDTSYRRTAEAEVEDRAWILTQIAHLSLLTCRTEAADRLLTEALRLFPDYHYALAQMSDVRQQQARLTDAIALRQRHAEVAPHPENLFELGVALHRAGRQAEAHEIWTAFEASARAEMHSWDSANIELIYYYADYVARPAEALILARKEAARRQDVRTLEALAWALHRNGQPSAAQAQIEKVLAVGVAQPATFARAAAIAEAGRDTVTAQKLATRSIKMCSSSTAADQARDVLARVAGTR